MQKWLLILLSAFALSGCGYNDFQRLDEQTKSAWSEVLNQYQRRADLVPNLVATVKGEANFEQETLTRVIEARSRATAVQVTPETLNDPQAFQRFQQAQGELSSALSSLLGDKPVKGALAAAIGLAIATVKASLVAAFFMHLISEKRLVYWVLALTAVLFLPLLLFPVLTSSSALHR